MIKCSTTGNPCIYCMSGPCGYRQEAGQDECTETSSKEMTLNGWTKAIHDLAVEKGWWDKDVPLGDCIANVHAELSEAWEAYRCKMPMMYYGCSLEGPDSICPEDGCSVEDAKRPCDDRLPKPEGIAVEMADALIRILDWCGAMGVDIEAVVRAKHEYNQTRPYRHGGKQA